MLCKLDLAPVTILTVGTIVVYGTNPF